MAEFYSDVKVSDDKKEYFKYGYPYSNVIYDDRIEYKYNSDGIEYEYIYNSDGTLNGTFINHNIFILNDDMYEKGELIMFSKYAVLAGDSNWYIQNNEYIDEDKNKYYYYYSDGSKLINNVIYYKEKENEYEFIYDSDGDLNGTFINDGMYKKDELIIFSKYAELADDGNWYIQNNEYNNNYNYYSYRSKLINNIIYYNGYIYGYIYNSDGDLNGTFINDDNIFILNDGMYKKDELIIFSKYAELADDGNWYIQNNEYKDIYKNKYYYYYSDGSKLISFGLKCGKKNLLKKSPVCGTLSNLEIPTYCLITDDNIDEVVYWYIDKCKIKSSINNDEHKPKEYAFSEKIVIREHYTNILDKLIDKMLDVSKVGGKVKCIYSNTERYVSDIKNNGKMTFNDKDKMTFNEEHIIPALIYRRNSPIVYDLHNIFPCDEKINSERSNYMFADDDLLTSVIKKGYENVENEIRPIPNTYTKNDDYAIIIKNKAYIKMGINEETKKPWYSCNFGRCFIIPYNNRGMIARSILYFHLVWSRDDKIDERLYNKFIGEDYKILKTMAKWHLIHKPDIYEIEKNNKIAKIQRNKNPFVHKSFNDRFKSLELIFELPYKPLKNER